MSAEKSSARFEKLVREHHAAVYRAAHRVLLNVEDARDVTQQVFLRAFEKRDTFAGPDEARARLCWMASRMALTHLRGDRRRRRREGEKAMHAREQRTQGGRGVGLEEQDRALFGQLLRRLPDELRVALALRYQDEMTYAQIGEVMTVSEASAHDRVRRGMERLRDAMRRAGLGGFVAGVEGHLADAPAAPVPPGLVEHLLTAKLPTAVSLALPAPLTAGIALAFVAVGVGALAWREAPSISGTRAPVSMADAGGSGLAGPLARDGGGRNAPDAQGRRPAETQSPGAAVAETLPSDERTARISGTVTNPDGIGVEGLLVAAHSYVRAGKLAAYGGHALTDVHGRYELEVPVRQDDGEFYRVVVEYDQALVAQAPDARVEAGRTLTGFDIELERPLEERAGSYELILQPLDEEGAPFPKGALVVIRRRLPTVGGGVFHRWEDSGRLGASGEVLLRGSKLGPKRVTVQLQDGEAWAELDLVEAGRSVRTVATRFDPGRGVSAPLDAVDEERPRYWLSGFQSELVGGAPVLRTYPEVWVYPVPELSRADYLFDFLPNRIFRPSVQTAYIGDPPAESPHFRETVRSPGRYVAVGYEHPYAPAVSEVVTLSEDSPAAEGIELSYEAPGSLSGTVLDVDGRPLPNALLFVTGTGPISDAAVAAFDVKIKKAGGEGVFAERVWRTDAEGRFTITGLPSGVPVCAVALHPERLPSASRTVYASSGKGLSGLAIRFVSVRTR